mmetsp:Transcript_35313/g.119573  ORF Transcript_35313/g.119573 Transcript_35313/m.119573 type:complete len:212 (-) Transcript_35313:23-658(-)
MLHRVGRRVERRGERVAQQLLHGRLVRAPRVVVAVQGLADARRVVGRRQERVLEGPLLHGVDLAAGLERRQRAQARREGRPLGVVGRAQARVPRPHLRRAALRQLRRDAAPLARRRQEHGVGRLVEGDAEPPLLDDVAPGAVRERPDVHGTHALHRGGSNSSLNFAGGASRRGFSVVRAAVRPRCAPPPLSRGIRQFQLSREAGLVPVLLL